MEIKKVVCPFLCMLLLCGCTQFSLKRKNNPQQEAGETIQALGYRDHSVYSIQYPEFKIDVLDKQIKDIVDKREQDFMKRVANYDEKRKAEFNVTYESYVKKDQYVSIQLNVYESIYQNKEDVVSVVYDVKQKKIIHLSDILTGEYLSFLSSKAVQYFQERFPQECENDLFYARTSAAEENFSNFIMKKDRLVFFYPQGRLFDNSATFEIMYSDLQSYTDLRPETLQAFVPYDQVLNEETRPIYADKPMVALTFDDGPSKYTPSILDALKENNASATFFVLGSNAHNAPEILQRMILEGNEIGNHTYSHKQLTTLSKEGIEEEISETKECIYEITQTYPQLLRPPYGSKNDMVVNCAKDETVVTWTLDTRDWLNRDVKVIVNRIMDTVKDGDIILMHDLYATSAQAAKIAIGELKDKGYQLVTVSQLYEYRKKK